MTEVRGAVLDRKVQLATADDVRETVRLEAQDLTASYLKTIEEVNRTGKAEPILSTQAKVTASAFKTRHEFDRLLLPDYSEIDEASSLAEIEQLRENQARHDFLNILGFEISPDMPSPFVPHRPEDILKITAEGKEWMCLRSPSPEYKNVYVVRSMGKKENGFYTVYERIVCGPKMETQNDIKEAIESKRTLAIIGRPPKTVAELKGK